MWLNVYIGTLLSCQVVVKSNFFQTNVKEISSIYIIPPCDLA